MSRKKQLYWYIKIIDFYAALFKENRDSYSNNYILGPEYFRKLGTYFAWEETIKTLVWFSRVLPQREGDLFKRLMISDEAANEITRGRSQFGKDIVSELKNSFKSEIDASDFYTLVKQIYVQKEKIDTVYTVIGEFNSEEHGVRLNHSFDNKFLKMIHLSACQSNSPQR